MLDEPAQEWEPAAQSFWPFSEMPKHFSFVPSLATGPALAAVDSIATAVATAPASAKLEADLAKTDIGHSFLVNEECSPHEHGTLFFYAERKTFVTGPNKDPVTGMVTPVAALLIWLQFQSGSLGRPELTGPDDKKVIMARCFFSLFGQESIKLRLANNARTVPLP
jgi:hypothetical protein